MRVLSWEVLAVWADIGECLETASRVIADDEPSGLSRVDRSDQPALHEALVDGLHP